MREKLINITFLFGAFLLGGITMLYVSKNYVSSNNVNVIGGSGNVSYIDYGIDDKVTYSKVTVVDNGLSDAVSKIYDAVVLINNYRKNTIAGSGSGFVYKVDNNYGYIMTNHHVIEGSTKLKVTLSNEKEVDAELLGSDEYLDIAVIRIPVKDVIKIAEIGKSDNVKLGDTIFTIGSPVGEEYFNSVTRGIISGYDRLVTVSVHTTNDWVMRVLQVDAAINPGNSGGPLLNSNGQVIGVNSLKLVDNNIEGMGFAIKIEDAMAHVETLESGKSIERPLLGVTISNANNGISIVEIVEGGAASKSALQVGDVITKINDDKIINVAYLKYILYQYKVGDVVEISFIRNGKEMTTKITLQKK